ncbi:RecBCD enzyme subunit RecC [Serratia symbiotica]|nr:RecBCD enzyme subunit RecC [Serratia symbiotica]
MFTVYYSNKLKFLKNLTSSLIARDPLSNPFQQEVVLVKSPVMAEWLQIQLAEQFGIAANISFPMPSAFIWDMVTKVLPEIPNESAFTKKSMTWKLAWLLPELLTLPAFSILKHYLTDDCDKRKIYQLSTQVANLFDQYMVYRPQWLESWQMGELIDGLAEDQKWQAPLWGRLVECTRELGQSEWHFANLYRYLISVLENTKLYSPGLPQRVFVFGISILPPAYLNVLRALGRHIDIHLMFTNPCRYYGGDIQDPDLLIGLQSRECRHYYEVQEHNLVSEPSQTVQLSKNQKKQERTHPLLVSWGKLGRDYLYLLSHLEGVHEVDAFVEIPPDNILKAIQHDMLELENYAETEITQRRLESSVTKRRLELEDRSLSLHICHSQQREVEVLHNQLLNMLAEDPELTPRDIIVMAPDINSYTPYIQAVFGNAPANCYLAFSISDYKARPESPEPQAFISLLDLAQSRFTAEEVLTLLEVPSLAARFGITGEGLRLLRDWVGESGVRWGLDDDNVRDLDLPPTGQNTWHFGITRILLGYAMDSHSGDWQGILPYDKSSGLAAELAGKLADLLNSLGRWRHRLSRMRSLEEWLPLCQQLLDTFFVQDSKTEEVLPFIGKCWQQVISFGVSASYPDLVPLRVLRDDLVAHFDQARTRQPFFSGKINFCTLMQMRSIPFKVVCLLGMNEGVYPRELPLLGFNLMAKQPKCGDRTLREDDRYLFLEAILSAQQRLYISFIGCSIQDNLERYPSVLVTELLEYLEQRYCLPDVVEHLDASGRVNRVGEYLLTRHASMPFAVENFLPSSEQQSYASEWLPAAEGRGIARPVFNQSLLPLGEQEIPLDVLHRFYRHPIRAFFQLRLGVSFSLEEIELPKEEPFTLDRLSRYELNSQLLNTLITGESVRCLFQRACSAGQLPFGAFGEVYWHNQKKEMIELAKTVQAELTTNYNLELDIEIASVRISGWLDRVQDDGLLRWRPATLSVLDGIRLWIEHLVYCCMGGRGISRLYGCKNTVWCFEALTEENARKHLAELVGGYQRGLCHPLLLLHKSGWAWLTQCYQTRTQRIDWQEETQRKAQEKLIQAWQGDQHTPGEGEDPYLQRVFCQCRLDNKDLAQILNETERYLLPLARHKKG